MDSDNNLTKQQIMLNAELAKERNYPKRFNKKSEVYLDMEKYIMNRPSLLGVPGTLSKRDEHSAELSSSFPFQYDYSNEEIVNLRIFNHSGREEIKGHWVGFNVLNGTYEGAVISRFLHEKDFVLKDEYDYKATPLVIRDAPRFNFKTKDEINIEENDVILPFIEGTRVTVFNFPNGLFWGKTDHLEFIRRTGQNTVNYLGYLEDWSGYENLRKMVNHLTHTHAINLVIYSKELSAFDLPFYNNTETGVVVYNIENLKTHEYLQYEEVRAICKQFNVPCIEPVEQEGLEDVINKYGGYIKQTQDTDGEINYDIYRADQFWSKRKAVIKDLFDCT